MTPRLKEKEACRFFQQIISGIDYVHKLGIVHRDLKPENLLLDKNKNIKIVDFGLSNLYKTNEMLKTACGSPCYAAPEMIAGKKYVGLRVDIWSAGVILYAMICGYLPFDDPDTQLLYRKIMSGDYTIPSHVSPEGRKLMESILNIDPERRYTIEQIRNHPWYKLHTPKEPQGIIVGYHKIPLDETILNQVPSYGYDIEEVKKNINNNKHNKMTTLYYLLMLKAAKTGHSSPADITSSTFTPELIGSGPSKTEREASVERNIGGGRSESIPKQRQTEREPSENRGLPSEKNREREKDREREREREKERDDSLTPSRGRVVDGSFGGGSKVDPRKSETRQQDSTKPQPKPSIDLNRSRNTGVNTSKAANNNNFYDIQKPKSPKVSMSPVPRRDEPTDRQRNTNTDLGTSMELDSSLANSNMQKKILMNKIKEINEGGSKERRVADPLVSDSRAEKNRAVNTSTPNAGYNMMGYENRSVDRKVTPSQQGPSATILKESFKSSFCLIRYRKIRRRR